ncbi:NUDIX hydrolase [Reichenbachiella sp. MALMAid0571]|uniref:NUDIX hydrolase n=1 Tax=Reichenbachiella sp. MALMAid0571 TaxID=3143939 RepID=UPI0032E02C2A
MTRQDIRNQLCEYESPYPEEQAFVPRFLSLLEFPNCFERTLLTGHITASAWITDQSMKNTLLLHHRKLGRWLQPGGHADSIEDVVAVAKKEMEEETGLSSFYLAQNGFFDIDIHSIPERGNVPEHEHYDIRFHFIAKKPNEVVKNEESLNIKWIPLEEVLNLVNHEQSFIRMVEKNNVSALRLIK